MAKKKKKSWYKNFWILLGITIIDLLIPDPIPFVDEIVIFGWTSYLGIRMVQDAKK